MAKKITNKKIIEIYMKKGCNVSATCQALNISRATFYRYKEKSKALAQQLVEAEEAVIDNAETILLSKINDGDTTALIFFLKTKGKKRGYIEKIETEELGERLAPVQIVLPSNGR